MLTTSNSISLIILIGLCFLIVPFLDYLLRKKNKKQIDKIFIVIFYLLLFWMSVLALQIICVNKFKANPIYFDYFVYISVCYLPVAVFFMSLIFTKTKITFSKKYYALFIIPTLSIILLWTNDWHHLFYKEYSTKNIADSVYGAYFNIHYYYTYILFGISLFILMKYSIKNSGIFSRQAILILVGALIPIVTNLLGMMHIVAISIYTTPITLTITIILIALATFKLNLFKITPIALQRIVDRISDSYIVLNENYLVSDFNETFIKTFNIDNPSIIRGKSFRTLLKEYNLDNYIEKIFESIKKVESSNKTDEIDLYINKIEKYFNVEITSIISKNQFLGILILFKDVTQHRKDMETIQNNQNMLIERERLASLGQMVGGIAHSLKTPIFSISGGIEGLSDLIKEFDESIDDPTVTNQDMHDIAKDMYTWIDKMKSHLSYMSEVITTVKGQAVNLSGNDSVNFTIEEIFSHTSILMKHELQRALVDLNVENNVGNNIILTGNMNSLVQVLNNLISNAIQAYNGKEHNKIDLKANIENNNIIITIRDYGPGLPSIVKDKLFKEMITTKGKEGTGLGLFMSYSMIKAKFNGDIKYETSSNGTEFNIILPINVDN